MIRKKLTSENFNELVDEATQMLKSGHTIIYPTDTLYALGVDALNKGAVRRFFSLKRRPENKPVPLFVKDIAMARKLAFLDVRQERILERAWPGPYTFVLYKRSIVSMRISANTQKVGLRIPDNDFARALLNTFNSPITASSANVSGEPATTDPKKIIEQFLHHSVTPDYFIDAGELEAQNPSAVIDISASKSKILRISPTSSAAFKDIIG